MPVTHMGAVALGYALSTPPGPPWVTSWRTCWVVTSSWLPGSCCSMKNFPNQTEKSWGQFLQLWVLERKGEEDASVKLCVGRPMGNAPRSTSLSAVCNSPQYSGVSPDSREVGGDNSLHPRRGSLQPSPPLTLLIVSYCGFTASSSLN